MAYVSDLNLTQFWGLAKGHINAEDGRFANWQQTEKAGVATCWPVGGTELLPTVEFIFSETGPAEGTKGPDNPSTITGVSSVKVTRCGKNLVGYSYNSSTTPSGSSTTSGGITVSNDCGVYAVSGSNTSGEALFFVIVTSVSGELVLPPGDYVFLADIPSSVTANIRVQIIAYRNGIAIVNTSSKDSSVSFTITDGDPATIRIYIRIGSGETIPSGCIARPQLELGSTATAFEPYSGTDYTIDLGNTYYGGSIVLATGVMTVTHVAVTPDASTVDISSAPAALPLDYADTFGRTITSADGTSLVVGSTGGTVVYKLATPQTVQLTPTEILSIAQPDKYTPRLNTIYTDASAVQVGYAKSPIRSEYELTQAIIATEGGE